VTGSVCAAVNYGIAPTPPIPVSTSVVEGITVANSNALERSEIRGGNLTQK